MIFTVLIIMFLNILVLMYEIVGDMLYLLFMDDHEDSPCYKEFKLLSPEEVKEFKKVCLYRYYAQDVDVYKLSVDVSFMIRDYLNKKG